MRIRARAARNVVVVLAAVLFAVWLAGSCGYSGDPLIDGIRIGGVVACADCDQPDRGPYCHSCDSVSNLARGALSAAWPDQATPTSLSFHDEGCPPSWTGMCHPARTATLRIVVADYADGSRHAVAVSCGVGGCASRPGYQSTSVAGER